MTQITNYFYDDDNTCWFDATNIGYDKIKYIDNNGLLACEISNIINSITYNECLGVYNYIYKNKNNLFNSVLKLNPFSKDLILNAHLIFFWINNELMKDNIDEYPEQKQKLNDIMNDYDDDYDYVDDYYDY